MKAPSETYWKKIEKPAINTQEQSIEGIAGGWNLKGKWDECQNGI